MARQIVTAPSGEPVSLAEAKLHLRLITDPADTSTHPDDAMITSLITATRQDAETITRRALVSQQWKAVFDRFPSPGMNIASATWYGPQWGTVPGPLTMLRPDDSTGYEINVPLPPLQTVDSIKYIDQDGVQQTLATSQYLVDSVSEPARITPAYGLGWPATRQQVNAVELTFTCGYGVSTAVPAAITAWMKLRIGAMYENREEIVVGQRLTSIDLPFVDRLLDPYRVVVF